MRISQKHNESLSVSDDLSGLVAVACSWLAVVETGMAVSDMLLSCACRSNGRSAGCIFRLVTGPGCFVFLFVARGQHFVTVAVGIWLYLGYEYSTFSCSCAKTL